jgi:hypothetical protein
VNNGGALGSYQAGVYETLASSPYLPDWVAGISIGAINAALIAGNPPENRVAQLRRFWEGITAPTAWWPAGLTGQVAAWQRSADGIAAIMFGQPGFFTPRPHREWFSPTMPTSYYSTAALKETLEQLVDFDRINNAKGTRISVGAVNARTGRFAYFDSAEMCTPAAIVQQKRDKLAVSHRMRSLLFRSRAFTHKPTALIGEPLPKLFFTCLYITHVPRPQKLCLRACTAHCLRNSADVPAKNAIIDCELVACDDTGTLFPRRTLQYCHWAE